GRCAPGGGEALEWFQNAAGLSRTSHPPSAPRGENTRSLARVASSSRRMPAINPSKPYLVSASFNPSVLRAADRAAGGKVGSTLSIGGQGSTLRSSSHSLLKRSRNAYISGNFLPVSTCKAGNGTRPKKALRASQIITLESFPSDHSSASFFNRAKASRRM